MKLIKTISEEPTIPFSNHNLWKLKDPLECKDSKELIGIMYNKEKI